MSAFKKGELVRIKTLKKEGTVLELLNTGGYRVHCGSLNMVCKESELESIPKDQWKKYSKHVEKGRTTYPTSEAKSSIDLHGRRVLEGLAEVQVFLDAAIMADLSRVEIVHGVGTGKLLAAIHQYLSTLSTVKKYQLDTNNPGVTIVYF